MTTYTGPDRSWNAGVPTQVSDDFAVTPEGLITGEYPTQFVQDIPAAADQSLEVYTIVGLDGNGRVIPAVEGTTQAIGILVYPVSAGAGENPAARVLRSACINPLFEGLVWDASYGTDTEKMNAFEGAPSPTQFVTRPLAQYTPVAP